MRAVRSLLKILHTNVNFLDTKKKHVHCYSEQHKHYKVNVLMTILPVHFLIAGWPTYLHDSASYRSRTQAVHVTLTNLVPGAIVPTALPCLNCHKWFEQFLSIDCFINSYGSDTSALNVKITILTTSKETKRLAGQEISTQTITSEREDVLGKRLKKIY